MHILTKLHQLIWHRGTTLDVPVPCVLVAGYGRNKLLESFSKEKKLR
jgi:hypothetical protein